jgi:hypothetical protein
MIIYTSLTVNYLLDTLFPVTTVRKSIVSRTYDMSEGHEKDISERDTIFMHNVHKMNA